MEKVSGIGGLFFGRATPTPWGDGIAIIWAFHSTDYAELPWCQEAGPSIVAPFPETTTHFGDDSKVWMLNFRVHNPDAMVAQLRGAGISVEVDPQRHPNGRFARLRDPEGNPIELWKSEGQNTAR